MLVKEEDWQLFYYCQESLSHSQSDINTCDTWNAASLDANVM